MNTQHTHGPWHVDPSETNTHLTSVFNGLQDRGHLPRPWNVAICTGPQARANARLIAAAPDMLAALEELAETAPLDIEAEDSVNEYRKFVMRTARKAITKATQ